MLTSSFTFLPSFENELRASRNVIPSLFVEQHDPELIEQIPDFRKQLNDGRTRRKRMCIKAALAKGDLLQDVTLCGNRVILNLKDKYNSKDHYRSINFAFHNLHNSDYSSALFKVKFECPPASRNAPVLKLKEDHGFKDAKEVQDFLQSCASKRGYKASDRDPEASLEKAFPAVENPSTLLAETNSQHSSNGQHPVSSYDLLFYNETLVSSSAQPSPVSPMPSYQVSPAEIHPSLFEERIKQLEAQLMVKDTELELKDLEIQLLKNEQLILKRKLPPEFANTTTNDQEVTQAAKRFRK